MTLPYDPYGFHEMLVKLGKKYLPQQHEVPDFIQPVDRYAYSTSIISGEFDPIWFQSPVDVTGHEIVYCSGDARILELLRCKFEFAFMDMRRLINNFWNHQVMPADVPSGE